jgi:arginase
MNRPITVLDAPSNLGLRPPRPGAEPGVWGLARSLRARGLVERLAAEDGGAVERLPYSPAPDPETGYRNGAAIGRFSLALSERTRALVRSGRFALVLGGDCSVLLGGMLALKGLGRYGLVFLDGHDDYSPPRDMARYRGLLAAAGQDLALVTGRGPDALANLEGRRPYVAEEDVAALGVSPEPSDARDFEVERFDRSRIARWDRGRVRALGAPAAAAEVRARMEAAQLDGFWIHLDVDVLDQAVMPAVDSPNPDGLSLAELTEILRVLLASPGAVGLEVTIYDPELDPTGAAGDGLAEALVSALAGRRRR